VTTLWDMVAAELLKLRKRRGLFWWSVVLVVGSVIVIEVAVQIVHIFDSSDHGPAGGTPNFAGTMSGLSAFSGLTAVLIGTTAGSGDVTAGVFRDLVSTGRSRLALFAVRLPGAVLMFVPLLVIAYLIAVAVCYGLAGNQATPSAGLAVHFGLWLLAGRFFDLCLAVGFAALIGARGIAIGVLLAWQLAVGPILASITFFGVFREMVPAAASDRLRPVVDNNTHLTPMSIAAALIVLAVWAAALLAAGAWRTATVDA
jgi:ABC-type transport system involved in multi-copper enzyme maturation permease subunit